MSFVTPEMNEEYQALKKNPLVFYILQHRRSFLLGMFFLLITNGLDAMSPLFLKSVVDLATVHADIFRIAEPTILFFLSMSGLAITRYLWRVHFGRYHTDAAEDLRNRIFNHLTGQGPQFFKKNNVGELLSLIINDVQSFRGAIGQGTLVLVDGIVISAFILPTMLWLNFSWAWKTLILLPTVPVIIKIVTDKIFRYYKIQQDKQAELSGIAQEIIAGIRVIKSFAQEKNKLEYYNRYNLNYEKTSNKTAKWDSLFMPTMEFGVAAGSIILLFIGSHDVLAGLATVGTLVAFQRYITKMVWPMTAFGMGLSQYKKGMASFSRITDILDQATDVPDEGTSNINGLSELEIRNLNFKYPDGNQNALENISFKIKPGELIGIVGPVGSGKTTLVHLLTRLYPAPKNTIFINGKSIEQVSQESLHKTIMMVPQETFLFSESISSNISYGLHEIASDKELTRLAKLVDVEDEVIELPQRFSSQLGERGVNLSGGQKQRLTIARALATESDILILDDSLSAVDVNTESRIKEALEQLNKKIKTRVIIAHRLSSVLNADKIIVLKEGRIEAIGKHNELLTSSPTYKSLADLQGFKNE
jgi:ATP-binding cassette, subfamily B, multidrug efflux pump